MRKLKTIIVNIAEEYKILLRNLPMMTIIFFILSGVFMNIFAQKELINLKWVALDCGFLLSWISFLCMDMITKRFGARAAIEVSILSVGVNIVTSIIFYIMSIIGTTWSVGFDLDIEIANRAVNNTIGGTWYVIVGSMIAFLVSAIVNAIVNEGIGKLLKSETFKAYAARTYISTALGQFTDNLVFATIVSKVFFGWSWSQVIVCSVCGGLFELIAEILFSPIGFKICKRWGSQNTGKEYIEYISRHNQSEDNRKL